MGFVQFARTEEACVECVVSLCTCHCFPTCVTFFFTFQNFQIHACVKEIFFIIIINFTLFFFFGMIYASNGSSKVALMSKRLKRSLGLLLLVFMKEMVLFKNSSF